MPTCWVNHDYIGEGKCQEAGAPFWTALLGIRRSANTKACATWQMIFFSTVCPPSHHPCPNPVPVQAKTARRSWHWKARQGSASTDHLRGCAIGCSWVLTAFFWWYHPKLLCGALSLQRQGCHEEQGRHWASKLSIFVLQKRKVGIKVCRKPTVVINVDCCVFIAFWELHP